MNERMTAKSNALELVTLAIMDCEAAGSITHSAARVVARTAAEALRDCGNELSEPMNSGSRRLARCYWRRMMERALR